MAPELRRNRTVLLVAHGNSLRALVKMLDGLSEEAIVELNIPTGVPLLYELDEDLKAARQPLSGRCRSHPGRRRGGARANRAASLRDHLRSNSRVMPAAAQPS